MAKPLHRALLPQVLDDLRALAEIDEDLVDAALQAVGPRGGHAAYKAAVDRLGSR